MRVMGNVVLLDELTYMAVIDSFVDDWIQHDFGGLGANSILEHARDRKHNIKWNWRDLTGLDRSRDSALVNRSAGLIGYLRSIIRMRFSRTRCLRKRVERYLGRHDDRRLPVSQPIRRNCRMAHEVHSADSQNGDDDD